MNPEPVVAAATLAKMLDEEAAVLDALADGADIRAEPGTLNPVRLDPKLWRPPLQFHPRTARDERREARREWRKANRPFRRAFGGGELRRHVLHQVGVSNAKRAES